MSQVTEDRAAIEERIAGRTLCTELEHTAAERGAEPAYSDKVGTSEGDSGWRTVTWEELRERVLDGGRRLRQARFLGRGPARHHGVEPH